MTAGTATTYPRRRPFFANRFCRLMTKVCLANQIGPEACFLLMTVVMTEDAKSYRASVTFWNEQLMALLGVNSVKSLIRIRNRAVESGWLHYEQGGKGVVGRYWVEIPREYEGMDDTPVDENAAEYRPVSHGENDTRRAGEGQDKRHGCDSTSGMDVTGEVATILPLPNPLPKDPPNPPQAGGTGVKKQRPKKPPQHPESIEVPPSLDTPEFRQTWADWLAARAGMGKTVSEIAAKQQLADLSAIGPQPACECIRASIRNQWQGLFIDKQKAKQHGTQFKTKQQQAAEQFAREAEVLEATERSFLNTLPGG